MSCGVYGNVIRFLAPITIPDAHFAEAMDILEARGAQDRAQRTRLGQGRELYQMRFRNVLREAGVTAPVPVVITVTSPTNDRFTAFAGTITSSDQTERCSTISSGATWDRWWK